VFSALNKEEITSLQRLLKHKKEKKNIKFTNSWRSGAAGQSLAQTSQMAAPWRRRHGAWRRTLRSLRSGARIRRSGADARKKNYKFDFLSQLGLQKFDGK
jgi:hypothetical protein